MQNHKKDDLMISLSDFIFLCKKQKNKILFFSLLIGTFCVLFALVSPVKYVVKGTFKEKARSSSNVPQSLNAANFFAGGGLGGNSTYNETISLMRSRKLLERVIRQLGLQSDVKENGTTFPLIKTLRDNLKIEYAYLLNHLSPILKDPKSQIKIIQIDYKGEEPRALTLKFTSENAFQVIEKGVISGMGTIGAPYQTNEYSFIALKTINGSIKDEEFLLSILPLNIVINNNLNQLSIESDQVDKSLLNIKYSHRDRQKATLFVNTLMAIYQNYLRQEQDRVAGEQIAYLQNRQDEMGNKLKNMMEVYAQSISADMSTIGFSDSNKAMEFLAEIQNRYKNKLLEIDFEVKRLQNAQNEGYGYYETYTSRGDSHVINNLLHEIRELKQYRDTVDLGLRNFPEKGMIADSALFDEQLKHFDELKEFQEETSTILAALEQGRKPPAPIKLSQDFKYVAKNWHETLVDREMAFNEASNELKNEKLDELRTCRHHYSSYLQNLQNFFGLHEKMLEECIQHQQRAVKEFQGIDVKASRELYIKLKLQLSEIETLITQHQFIVDQMQDPNFEYSSLSQVLTDAVSGELILRTTRLTLSLKDEINRSIKEQERLQSEIQLQKSFLHLHLKQMIELLKLRQTAIREKVIILQTETLSVAQQQISILEKHIQDYIAIRLKDLNQERLIIQQYQHDLKREMSDLPNKWVAEKLIDLQMNMNRNMVEDVTAFVESKNISNNLETVQSAPIDQAVAPIHPQRPRLVFFGVLGMLLGALFSIAFFVFKSLYEGLPITQDNLRYLGRHVSGNLSKGINQSSSILVDEDIESLRKLVTFIDSSKTLLIFQGRGPDYSQALSEILSRKQKKVLLMPLYFDVQAQENQLPGLLQYLEHHAEFPTIIHRNTGDFLSNGGISRIGTELLGSKSFLDLLEKLKKEYDHIIAVSHAIPGSAQADGLLNSFDKIAVTIYNEKLPNLEKYLKMDTITYLFYQEI